MQYQAPVVLRRRWLRMSVRRLVVIVMMTGGALGWLARSARIQREAVEAIQRAGGYVTYDWEYKNGESFERSGPRWPKWLVTLLGVAYFGNVTVVQLQSAHSDQELHMVKHFSQLESLILEGAKITDQGLTVLEGKQCLVRLDLSDTRVGDQGLAHVRGLSRLEVVHLDGTDITDEGLARMKGMTGLKTLGLRGTKVTDGGLAHLKGLSNLTSLDLDGTKITDGGLARIAGLTKLKTLSLSATLISDEGLAYLEGLSDLTCLSLDGTQISDSGLAHLKLLTNLEELRLWSPKITPTGVSALQAALPKLKINPVYWMTAQAHDAVVVELPGWEVWRSELRGVRNRRRLNCDGVRTSDLLNARGN